MYGIRKTVITNSAVFVLDNSGSVHKWDSDDEFWSPNVLERGQNLAVLLCWLKPRVTQFGPKKILEAR